MKLWFDYCKLYDLEDNNVKFGIGWYRHHKGHRWWGLTIELYGFGHKFLVHYVDNWAEYDKRINSYKYRKKDV